ncbi:MAG: nitrilase-related carbon-nitrogen hydrolase, partial [Fibrobacter sp.]|nr:nitrilase-related carbon-nitrogen hydrolase [Fibrobacter sp.]
MKNFRIALCQIVPGLEKDKNVVRALEMVSEAACGGAKLITLPEMFYYPFELGALKNICGGEEEILLEFRNLAAKHGVYICTGSMAVKQEKGVFNRSYLIDPNGSQVYFYDKRMLFDVDFRHLKASESSIFTPGKTPVFQKTELCSISTVICYDIRFGRIVEEAVCGGAELLLVPAVFNQVTGPAHW